MRTASCAASSASSTRPCAPATTSPIAAAVTRMACVQGWRPVRLRQLQAGFGEGAGPAEAASVSRNLGLRSTRGGHPPALRAGGAWWPALVGSPRGLPHRSAGPGQGTDGEEHGHRASRLSKGGFFCKQSPDPSVDRDAWFAEGMWPATNAYSSTACSISPTTFRPADGKIVRRPAWCATTAMIPIWWSLPTRARRRSPTSPTASPRLHHGFWLDDAFASGGSVGYDHKGMGITARGGWESVKRHFRALGRDSARARTSPASASATCPATCSATACCCPRTSVCWLPSITVTYLSRPESGCGDLVQGARRACSRSPRSSVGLTTTPALISKGGGVFPAYGEERFRCRRRSSAGAGYRVR